MSTRGWSERAIDFSRVRWDAYTASFESEAHYEFMWTLGAAYPEPGDEVLRKVRADVILEFCDRGWFTIARSPWLTVPPVGPIPGAEWEAVLRDQTIWQEPDNVR